MLNDATLEGSRELFLIHIGGAARFDWCLAHGEDLERIRAGRDLDSEASLKNAELHCLDFEYSCPLAFVYQYASGKTIELTHNSLPPFKTCHGGDSKFVRSVRLKDLILLPDSKARSTSVHPLNVRSCLKEIDGVYFRAQRFWCIRSKAS